MPVGALLEPRGLGAAQRLYMDQAARTLHAGFEHLQSDLMQLLDALCERYTPEIRVA